MGLVINYHSNSNKLGKIQEEPPEKKIPTSAKGKLGGEPLLLRYEVIHTIYLY